MAERVRVQVCYALPDAVSLLTVDLDEGQTLEQAIHASGVLARHPEIDLGTLKIGVFGKLRQLSDLVRAGDRIEIYRPLIADPKDSRRRRAQHKSRAAGKN
jgi:putative ubiquitin-RnfH superfamily antitoxin RatB of RatAB toxin-antitoxin module